MSAVAAFVFGRTKFETLGTTGFEPATYCSQSSRATKLRHVPLDLTIYHAEPEYGVSWHTYVAEVAALHCHAHPQHLSLHCVALLCLAHRNSNSSDPVARL